MTEKRLDEPAITQEPQEPQVLRCGFPACDVTTSMVSSDLRAPNGHRMWKVPVGWDVSIALNGDQAGRLVVRCPGHAGGPQ